MRLLVFIASYLFAVSVYAASNPLAIGGKHDNNEPIEITSDALEVFQQENRAVFTGHVVAIQGDVRLKSEKMTVYYKASEEKTAGDKTPAADEKNSIRKIEVEGSVFLSTPEETASGLTGVYDVENHEIRLNDNVVLTRAKNVLKGDHLVYNLETGKSVVTGGATAAEQTAAPGRKERVRALFVPENKEKK